MPPIRPLCPRLLRVAAVVACALLLQPHRGEGQVLNEVPLKSTYLLSFVDFVHWDRAEKDPLVIGVVGSEAYEREIQELAARKAETGAARGFAVRMVREVRDLAEVDVLFFAKGHRGGWDGLLDEARRRSILTVGEEEGFLEAGGLIEFVIQRNRLKFMLNLEASEAYRIGLSSKLARLAVN